MAKLLTKVRHSLFKTRKRTTLVVLLSVFVLVITVFVQASINPVILSTIEIQSKSLATRAMNSAISDIVMNNVVYDDLVTLVADDQGNISMIQANALEINNLSKDLAQATENKIDEYGRNGVNIPLGTFTGLPLMVGRGPKINIKVTPVGAVRCTFISQFEAAGINQTKHRIYLKISSDVSVVLPLGSQKYNMEQQVLISESIIVGKVPSVYLHSGSLDTLLNFVP